jgi:hypothetical protein
MSILSFQQFGHALRDFIARAALASPSTGAEEPEFNHLARQLFALQYRSVPAYQQICQRAGARPETLEGWEQIPAVPTRAFQEFDFTSLPEAERTTVFHSSGTTGQHPSRHFHSADSLAIYEASLLPWCNAHLLGDLDALIEADRIGPLDKLAFLALTPPPSWAPNSSLAYMFETVRRKLGARDSLFTGQLDATGAWEIDFDATLFALRKSMCANRPVVLLGTAFLFVHLLDFFAKNNMRYRLAEGSRVLETGGYKGRSRTVPKAELHQLVRKHLGITDEFIVGEYGMSELSSQAYDRTAGKPGERFFHFPPWARALVISPETGRPAPAGTIGLLRVIDLANVRSVLAIQTEDLAVQQAGGFELVGRAPEAVARGCSLLSA